MDSVPWLWWNQQTLICVRGNGITKSRSSE